MTQHPDPGAAPLSRREYLNGLINAPALASFAVGALPSEAGGPLEVAPTMAALRTIAPAPGAAVLVLGYRRPLDEGGGLYYYDAQSESDDDEGAVVQPSSRPARGRWRLRHDGTLHVAQFGASPGASAAANTAAIRAAMRLARNEGGTIVFAHRAVYRVDGALDFRSVEQGRRDHPRSIRGNGATLDFSASGIRSGALVMVGATQLEFASERVWSSVEDLLIRGPEDNDRIEPRHGKHAGTPRAPGDAAATTVVGLLAENAVRVNLRNMFVSHCHTAIRYRRCWGGVFENVQGSKAIVAHHVDEGCTHVTFLKPQANHATVAYLIRPERPSAAIGVLTMITPHLEDCTIGFHVDQNSTSGTEIDSVNVIDPYLENIFGDAFRVGIAFDPDPRNWAAVGADRAGRIMSFRVDGGRFAGSGVTAGYGPRRRAFRFASRANVAACRIVFPCGRDDVSNLPPQAVLQSLGRAEDTSPRALDFEQPGFGAARVDGGSLTFRQGNVDGVTRAGAGQYDLRFRRPYARPDVYVAVVTCRAGGVTAAIDPRASGAASVRVVLRDASGGPADASFDVMLQGQLPGI